MGQGVKWHGSLRPVAEPDRGTFYFAFAEDALSLGRGEEGKTILTWLSGPRHQAG